MALDKLLHQPSERVLAILNERFKEYQPGQLILATAGISLATAYFYGQLTHKVSHFWRSNEWLHLKTNSIFQKSFLLHKFVKSALEFFFDIQMPHRKLGIIKFFVNMISNLIL